MAVDRRTHMPPVTTLLTAASLLSAGALLSAPAVGLAAGSGGTAISGGTGVGSPNPLVQPADQPVTTSGDGLTLQTVASGQTKRALEFTGTAPASDAGRTVDLEHSTGAGPDPSWVVFAHARIARGGRFAMAWRATRGGEFQVEAVLASAGSAGATAQGGSSAGGGATSVAGSSATGSPVATTSSPTTASSAVSSTVTSSTTATGVPTTPQASTPQPATAPLTVSIYQSGVATIYGPGLYGHKTACGETLRRRTLGVASRTLACGTKVAVLFRGREMVVPVIDRGPYANGADWDLTMATARALGIRTTTTIGALRLAHT